MNAEKRFCTCGFWVFGTEEARRVAFAAHRSSGEHQRRIDEGVVLDADALAEADIERRLSR